jgi:hypothetical protein
MAGTTPVQMGGFSEVPERDLLDKAVSSCNNSTFEFADLDVFWRLCLHGVINIDPDMSWEPQSILRRYLGYRLDEECGEEGDPWSDCDRLVLSIQRLRYIYYKLQKLEKALIEECVNPSITAGSALQREKPRLTACVFKEEYVERTAVVDMAQEIPGEEQRDAIPKESIPVNGKTGSDLPTLHVRGEHLLHLRLTGVCVMRTIAHAMGDLRDNLEEIRGELLVDIESADTSRISIMMGPIRRQTTMC